MLIANPEAGTAYCLELAMTADSIQDRETMCVIFARVLSKGTKLGRVDTALKEYKNSLCEVGSLTMLFEFAIEVICIIAAHP